MNDPSMHTIWPNIAKRFPVKQCSAFVSFAVPHAVPCLCLRNKQIYTMFQFLNYSCITWASLFAWQSFMIEGIISR